MHLSLMLLLVFAVVGTAHAQPVAASRDHQMPLSVLVDGANTPDAISDELAYRHFLLALAERDNATPHEHARRASRLAPINLSDNDRNGVIVGLAGLKNELDRIEGLRRAIGNSSPDTLGAAVRDAAAQLASLKQQENDALTAARARVQAKLSPDGRKLFDQYVKEHVKRHIVILGAQN